MDPLLMIRPPRGSWLFMILHASWVQRNAPVRFVSTTVFHCSYVNSSRGTGGAPVPALLNKRSSRPNASFVRANRALMEAGSLTSVGTTNVREPGDLPSSAPASRSSLRRPAMTTATLSDEAMVVISAFPLLSTSRGRTGRDRRLREHRRGRLLDDRSVEEPRIARPPHPHGVGEGEVAEVLRGDETVLDELVGLRQHLEHVRHVEVADVGAEQRVEPRAERVDAAVERPDVHRVVGLTAKVEGCREQIAEIFLALDPARGVVVEVWEAAGARDGVGVGPAVPLGKRRHDVLAAVLPRQLHEEPAIEGAGIGVLERLPVSLLPVADEVGVQDACPPRTALEEGEPEIGEAACHPAEEQRFADGVAAGGEMAR